MRISHIAIIALLSCTAAGGTGDLSAADSAGVVQEIAVKMADTLISSRDSIILQTARELADSGFYDAAGRLIQSLAAVSDPDSQAYFLERDSLPGRLRDEVSISIAATADTLAAEGLFRAARDLLHDLLHPESAGPDSVRSSAAATNVPLQSKSGAGKKKNLEWNVRLTGDYNHIEDQDTLDSLYVLSGGGTGDWSGSARATAAWSADSGAVRRLSGNVSLASYLASAEAAGRFSLLWQFLPLTATVYGHKYLYKSYGDSSDNAGLRVQAEPTTRPSRQPFTLNLPVALEAVRHRFNRPDYGDFYRASLEPGISFSPPSGGGSRVRFSFLWERAWYPGADRRLNKTGYGPCLDFNVNGDIFSANGEVSVVWEKYPDNDEPTSPDAQRVVEVRPEAVVTLTDFLTVRLPVAARMTAADYTDSFFLSGDTLYYYSPTGDTTTGPSPYRFRINAPSVTVTPEIEWCITDEIQTAAAMAFEYNHTPEKHAIDGRPIADGVVYLEDSYTAYEPSVSCLYATEKMSAGVNAYFRYENIAEKSGRGRTYSADTAIFGSLIPDAIYIPGETYNFSEDSRSADITLDVQWQVVPWVAVEASAGCNLRWYAPFGANGRITRNYMVSLGIDARF